MLNKRQNSQSRLSIASNKEPIKLSLALWPMILPTHTHIIQLYTLILLEAIEACFVVLDGNRGDVAVQMRAEEEMPMEAEKAAIYQILILLSPYGHITSQQYRHFLIVSHALCLKASEDSP